MKSFQELIGDNNHCYGCGANNQKGLQVKSFWDGEFSAIACWIPEEHHCAGSKDIVNGGVTASLIDCHSVNLAMADAYKREGREVGEAPKIWYVTAQLNVSYKKPTPINKELVIKASIREVSGKKTWLDCDLLADEQVCVSAEVLAVRISR